MGGTFDQEIEDHRQQQDEDGVKEKLSERILAQEIPILGSALPEVVPIQMGEVEGIRQRPTPLQPAKGTMGLAPSQLPG